jgi:hypothetical protein
MIISLGEAIQEPNPAISLAFGIAITGCIRQRQDIAIPEASTSLVERQIAVVHSAAIRQVRALRLALEGTQIVFMILAGNAHSIRKGTLPSGRLYQATCFAALEVLK